MDAFDVLHISFRQLLAKFAGGILTLSSGLSMGREGPSVQMGSYIGDLVSKWGHILSGERKQLLAAGAGAGLAAAFAAPLAAATLVIESIERFDAPKTAITTILAGCRRRSDRQYDFPDQPVSRHTGHRTRPIDGTAHQTVYPICRHRIGFRQILFPADAICQTDVSCDPATRIYQAVRSFGHGIRHFTDDHRPDRRRRTVPDAAGGRRQQQYLLDSRNDVLHMVFTVFSFSSGLPGGSFIPTLVTGGLIGKLYALILVQHGIIGMENVSYVMLIGMGAFLIAVVAHSYHSYYPDYGDHGAFRGILSFHRRRRTHLLFHGTIGN